MKPIAFLLAGALGVACGDRVPLGSGVPGAGATGPSGLGGQGGALPAPSLFVDDFESADLLRTNAEGFDWYDRRSSSVVRDDGISVYNGAVIATPGPPGVDWTPFEGRHSLRIRFPAAEVWSYQRFLLGAPHRDLWARFWLRIPVNMQGPIWHELFALWMDGYGDKGEGATVIWSLRSEASGLADVHFSVSPGGVVTQAAQQVVPFAVAADRGRWMQLVFHLRASSTQGALDGVIECWRRFESESTFAKLHESFSENIGSAPNGPDGWGYGQLLGWANTPYAQDTEWLVDYFELSEQPLVPLP